MGNVNASISEPAKVRFVDLDMEKIYFLSNVQRKYTVGHFLYDDELNNDKEKEKDHLFRHVSLPYMGR